MSTLHGRRHRSPFASTPDRSSNHVTGEEEGITILASVHASSSMHRHRLDLQPPWAAIVPHRHWQQTSIPLCSRQTKSPEKSAKTS
ncbi:hypothetical protein DEO72_LG7g1330 [Vigna unguiculata]|uniref:Uncharacterized protein n=1 Tax=Vigna unguiculata TaxID=3917 RepID=A0A4D6MGX9_VIGUN|nr:hypothetical protein DEO72_LG7g1330 [Vigna unguiculata]